MTSAGICLLAGLVAILLTNVAAQDTCKGTCFSGNRCPRGYKGAGPPSKQCPGRRRKCCIKKPDLCARDGGICSPNNKCPDGYKSAGPPRGKCFGRKMKCCVPEETLHATCAMQPNVADNSEPVTGTLRFSQPMGGELQIDVDLQGFDAADTDTHHAIHVHEYGDIAGGCASSGSLYNPENAKQGPPDAAERRVGDFGNLIETGPGVVKSSFTDRLAKLSGRFSIIGRAIVLHGGRDDFMGGPAGPKIACCVIGWAAKP